MENLSRVERLEAALRWYEDQARFISSKLEGFNSRMPDYSIEAIEASLVALSIDGGKRAREALEMGGADQTERLKAITTETTPPLIRELLALLPAPGTEWCNSKRVEWLRASEACFRIVYKCDDPMHLVIGECGETRRR